MFRWQAVRLPVAQRSSRRTTNPSIDGMPKRLRLLITTHVKRVIHMRPFRSLLYIALTAASLAGSLAVALEPNHRLCPDRNLTANR
jgi:hypothetical protein